MKINHRNYLTVGDAAALLGLTERAVANYADSGRIPSVRHPLNSYRLFRKGDILAIRQGIEKALAEEGEEVVNHAS